MLDHPVGQSELIALLKQLLATAPTTTSPPFLDTLVNAQALLDRLEPPESKPGPAMNIAYLNLSVMAHNLLQRAGIQTLGDLLKHSEHSLAEIPHMGRKSVKVIQEALKPYGALAPNPAAPGNGRARQRQEEGEPQL